MDGAYRSFVLDPTGPIDRLSRSTVSIPYPWVDGETHHILLLTSTGVGFEHTIDVAQNALVLDGPTLWILALVGLLLGVAPVATGMLAYAALKDAGQGVVHFLLALTIGLLAYLLILSFRLWLYCRCSGRSVGVSAARQFSVLLLAVSCSGGVLVSGVEHR